MALRHAPPERPGQPGGKRDVNRRRRIAALSKAGLSLFLEQGIATVTIDDIAKAGGVAKGSFYRYFKDKTELVEAIVEPVALRIREAMDTGADALERAHDVATLNAAYEGLARDMVPIAIGYLDVVRLYLQEHRAPGEPAREPIRALAREIETRAIELTEVAVRHGLLRVPDPRVSALTVVGATEQLALSLLAGRLDASPADVARGLISLVLDGVRTR